MSWSVHLHGKSDALISKAAEEFEKIKYLKEPENMVKNAVGALVDQSLRAQIPACAVRIECLGSMSVSSQADAPDVVTSSLSVKVEPMHGFVFEHYPKPPSS